MSEEEEGKKNEVDMEDVKKIENDVEKITTSAVDDDDSTAKTGDGEKENKDEHTTTTTDNKVNVDNNNHKNEKKLNNSEDSSNTNNNVEGGGGGVKEEKEKAAIENPPPSTPAKPIRQRPALRGVLKRDENVIKWEGKWGMDDTAFDGGVTSAFSYNRVKMDQRNVGENIGLGDDTDIVTNAYYTGYFLMAAAGGKTRKISEKNILMEFCEDESLPESTLKVVGSGSNQFGKYTLEGTLVLKTGELNVYREYVPVVPGAGPATRGPQVRKGNRRNATKKNNTPITTTNTTTTKMKNEKKQIPSAAQLAAQMKKSGAIPPSFQAPARTGRIRRTPSHLVEDMLDDRVQEDMIRLKQIVRDVMKADREGWFGAPVDAAALGLVNYHNIIPNPMDLGTVLKKCDSKEYRSPDEIIEDVRLTFNNAITFNPDGHGVNVSARSLLTLFEKQLQKLHTANNNGNGGKKRQGNFTKKKSTGFGKGGVGKTSTDVFGSSDTDDSDSDAQEIRAKKRRKKTKESSSEVYELKNQIKMMNKQLAMMQELQQAGMNHIINTQIQHATQPIRAPPSIPPSQPIIHGTGATPLPIKSQSSQRPLSYQEKRQLGQDIHKLPPDMINGVIKIIEESGAPLGEDGDEVELDIEALDTPSLKKLQKYVKKALSKVRSKVGREADDSFY